MNKNSSQDKNEALNKLSFKTNSQEQFTDKGQKEGILLVFNLSGMSRSASRLRDINNAYSQAPERGNMYSRSKEILNNRSNSSSNTMMRTMGVGFYDSKVNNLRNQLTNLKGQKQNSDVKQALRKHFRLLYRGPERAYASMDFYGRGYILEEDLLNHSIVMSRIAPFTREDVKEFSRMFNLFKKKSRQNEGSHSRLASSEGTSRFVIGQGNMKNSSANISLTVQHTMPVANPINQSQSQDSEGMNFDQFKRMFFPQLFLISEEQDSDNEKGNKIKLNKKNNDGNQISKSSLERHNTSKEEPESVITERLKNLERILKNKFQNQWESVRKAFLALDTDYDGYITVEDILRYFGQGEKDLNYNDLKKLIRDKDSKKIGKIGYTDFSKWVGNSIHQSEGFYFRHDSVKNPQYEANLERNEKNQNNISKKKAQESLINQNLEKTVLDKIQFQWKTLRKAFMDLNMEKSGSIMPEELRFYFQHWGLNLTDEQFKYLFDKFDLDGDGKISYKDFQLTVGSEIHPAEGLYFRQDKPQQSKINSCKHEKCWQSTQGSQQYCSLHLKLHQDECSQLFGKYFSQLKADWPKFTEAMKKAADKDDINQIFLHDFSSVLRKFNLELTKKQQEMLLDAFPGRDEGDKRRINISRLYDHKYSVKLQKIYQKVDVHDNDGDDDPVDQSGYTGQFYRPLKEPLKKIDETQLVAIIAKNNKLVEVIRTIKEIDKQHNGFITTTELDDILKIQYKEELSGKDLRHIMKKYASIQNRVLVDYKKFRDSIVHQIKLYLKGELKEKTETFESPYKTNAKLQPQIAKKQIRNEILEERNQSDLSIYDVSKNKASKGSQLIQKDSQQYQLNEGVDSNKRPESQSRSLQQTNSGEPLKFEQIEQLRRKLQSAQNGDRSSKVTVSNLMEQQKLLKTNLENGQSKLVQHQNSAFDVINEKLQSRPRSRQEASSFFNSNRRGSTSDYLSQKRKIIGQELFNRTIIQNDGDQNLLGSKTPGKESSQKIKMKNLSQTLDGYQLQEGLSDYQDLYQTSKVHLNTTNIENKILNEHLKRAQKSINILAQTSHGMFGSRLNKGSISIQPKSSSKQQLLSTGQSSFPESRDDSSQKLGAVNNLLQNLRQQRQDLFTTISSQKQKRDKSTTDKRDYSALNRFLTQALNTQASDIKLDYPQTMSNLQNVNQSKKTKSIISQHYHSMQNSQQALEKLNTKAHPSSSTQQNSSMLAPLKNMSTFDDQRQEKGFYQTFNNSSVSSNMLGLSKFKYTLKSKLSYEWKNLYRQLSQNDVQSNGQVSVQDLEQALHKFNVFITKEEINKIREIYASNNDEASGKIDYQSMSQDLGLHNSSLSYLKNHSLRMQNIQKLRDIYSSEKKSRIHHDIFSLGGLSQDKTVKLPSRNFNNTIIDRVKTAAEGVSRYHSVNPKNDTSLDHNLSQVSQRKNLQNPLELMKRRDKQRPNFNSTYLEKFRIVIDNKNSNNHQQSLSNIKEMKEIEEVNDRFNQTFNIGKRSHLQSVNEDFAQEIKETSSIRDNLLQNIKQFRDMVQVAQKRSEGQGDYSLIGYGDFINILKTIGVNLSQQELKRFIVNRNLDNKSSKRNDFDSRSKSSSSHQEIKSPQWVDAKEFLKFYL